MEFVAPNINETFSKHGVTIKLYESQAKAVSYSSRICKTYKERETNIEFLFNEFFNLHYQKAFGNIQHEKTMEIGEYQRIARNFYSNQSVYITINLGE